MIAPVIIKAREPIILLSVMLQAKHELAHNISERSMNGSVIFDVRCFEKWTEAPRHHNGILVIFYFLAKVLNAFKETD